MDRIERLYTHNEWFQAQMCLWGLDDDQSGCRVQILLKPQFFRREQAFQATSVKNSKPHIFKTMHQIVTRFDKLMRSNAEALWVVLYDDATIPTWRTVAILNFKCCYNSVTD